MKGRSLWKRLVQRALNGRKSSTLFLSSIGSDLSIALCLLSALMQSATYRAGNAITLISTLQMPTRWLRYGCYMIASGP